MKTLRWIAAALAFGCTALSASADSWPSRPVKIVVGYPAGGASDVAARIVGEKLAQRLGQPVIIENKPGAAGNIGADFVAKAPPDGYTLLLGTISLSVNPSLYSKMTYDPVKDFTGISMISSTPFVLLVNAQAPYQSVKDLVAAARAHPGEIPYATAGNGSGSHLFMEQFSSMAGIKLKHIPYKGAAPAMTDVLGNQVSLTFDNILTTLPHIKSGKLRALAVSTAKRSTVQPDVPSLAESGVPGFDATAWFGLFAPAATPADVVQSLSRQVAEIVNEPETRAKLLKLGGEPVSSTPEAFNAFFRGEVARWAKVVKSAGVHLD
jgi:tripartite-type tricarboxylate transporter receptor subunit TctC